MRLGQWRQERAKVLVAQVEAVGILRQVYGVPERVSRLLELPGHPIASLLDRSDELLVFGRAMDLKEMVRRLPCFDLLLFQERQGDVVVLLIRCLSVRLAAHDFDVGEHVGHVAHDRAGLELLVNLMLLQSIRDIKVLQIQGQSLPLRVLLLNGLRRVSRRLQSLVVSFSGIALLALVLI